MQKQEVIDAFLLLLIMLGCVKNAFNLHMALQFQRAIKAKKLYSKHR